MFLTTLGKYQSLNDKADIKSLFEHENAQQVIGHPRTLMLVQSVIILVPNAGSLSLRVHIGLRLVSDAKYECAVAWGLTS